SEGAAKVFLLEDRRRTDHPGPPGELRRDYLARLLRAPEGTAPDLRAERDEEVITRPRDPTGDHHHRRVQHIDDVGDAGAEELRGLAHDLVRVEIAEDHRL